MTAGAFVGRLGPLAATFGVGAVVLLGGAGVAAADAAGSDDAGPAATNRSAPTATNRSGSAAGSVAGRTARPERGFSRLGPARPSSGIVPQSAVARIADPAPGNAQGAVSDPARPPEPEPEPPTVLPAPVAARVVQVNPEPAEAVSRPAPPASSAAVAGNRIASAAMTGSVVPQQLSAGATGSDPIRSFFGGLAALFNNQTPRLNPTQLTQNPSGVVTGTLGAVDPDSPRLTFTVAEGPVHGSAEVNADGSWTYTPEPAAAAAGVVDSFRVTVSDAASGFAIHGLAGLLNLLTFGLLGTRGDSSTSTVAVTVVATGPANNPPTGTFAVTGTSTVTGVVTGLVAGSDADGDPLTYGGSTTTAKGSVIVDAGTGGFTYTPTPAARHRASAATATAADLLDGFAVTISDGRGAATPVGVTVSVSPANIAPVAGVPIAGAPNVSTGVVLGSVSATDADGDTLAYSAPGTAARGSVSINAATGGFSYIPTAIARQNAAASGAAPEDLQDGFTVTIADGHGGTATAAVSVAIAPAIAPPVDPPVDPPGPLVAFPGAEGFGASATGGRDGSVIYVTNLNADGPGSLQWAVDQPGARYILFKVSGLIDTQIHLTNGDVTIAGQTSPGGITIRGLVTDETPYQDQTVRAPSDFSENWILQHIRIRPGAGGPSDDGLRLRYTRNAIVDHVSIGNATDEAIEISYSNNITVQNTIIAETVGGHSFYGGVLMNYSNPAHGFALDNVSLHHNVFNRIEGRLPEGSRESAAAANSFMNLELSNNLYWDPRFFIALGVDTAVAGGQPIYWKMNAVNNYFRTANGFPFGMFDDQILNVARNELFVSGNRMSLYPARSDYQLFYCCNDYPSETDPGATSRRAQARTSRHPFPEITYTPTDQLRSVLLNTAGAWPRDPMDIRLMQSVAADTISSAPIATNPANDALLPPYSGTAPAPPADTDNDGMPDTWETGKGLDPAVANTNARTLSTAGYTDLEVYLYELSTSRIGGSTV
jgi:VCBS repeat-containing protein